MDVVKASARKRRDCAKVNAGSSLPCVISDSFCFILATLVPRVTGELSKPCSGCQAANSSLSQGTSDRIGSKVHSVPGFNQPAASFSLSTWIPEHGSLCSELFMNTITYVSLYIHTHTDFSKHIYTELCAI